MAEQGHPQVQVQVQPQAAVHFQYRASELPKLDLDIAKGTAFQVWSRKWDAYYAVSGLHTADAAFKVNVLFLCFTDDTAHVVQNLGLSAEQLADHTAIIEALKTYVDGTVNETLERHHFRLRRQQEGEPFDAYLVALRDLIRTCNFCNDPCAQRPCGTKSSKACEMVTRFRNCSR